MICTRNAGSLEFEASLQWPPESEASPVFTGDSSFGERVRADLDESAVDTVDGCVSQVRGTLLSPYEDELRVALDGLLRELAGAASLREAALTARVLRSHRPLCAGSSCVESTARLLWEAGLRVGFGVSWSPAPEGADVIVGCRGAEERFEELLAPLMASRGVAG